MFTLLCRHVLWNRPEEQQVIQAKIEALIYEECGLDGIDLCGMFNLYIIIFFNNNNRDAT